MTTEMTASNDKKNFDVSPLWILPAVFFLVLVASHFAAITDLVGRWSKQEEYSHGFFIPLLSAWILWNRRDAIKENLGNGTWIGFVFLGGSILALILGELSALFLLAQLSFIFSLIGFALVLGGWKLLRICLFPIIFLVFAIPLPYFIDSTLSWRMQLLSSDWGVVFLRIFNVPVFLEGNVIDLGLYQLQVVDACSGLRYLFPLMSLGVLGAYLYQGPLWQRILIFLSTIPITIVMNSFRIGVIGIMVNLYGIEMAEGALHFFEGWVIFMACALILFGEIWLLNRLTGSGSVFDRIGFPTVARSQTAAGDVVIPRVPAITAICLISITALGLQLVNNRTEIVPQRQDFARFPLSLEDWRARQQSLDPQVETALAVSDYLLADYKQPATPPVNFYIAYYESQRKGVSPHSPRVCIPGGGWQINKFQRAEMPLGDNEPVLPVNRLIIENGDDKLLVYYWFHQRGKNIANEYVMKGHLLKDALVMNRTDGALIRVTTPINFSGGIAAAEERLQSFIRTAKPYLPKYIPGAEA